MGKFFEHLYPGKYYIYATDYDDILGDNVIGYMSIVLGANQSQSNEVKVTIYASELFMKDTLYQVIILW